MTQVQSCVDVCLLVFMFSSLQTILNFIRGPSVGVYIDSTCPFVLLWSPYYSLCQYSASGNKQPPTCTQIVK